MYGPRWVEVAAIRPHYCCVFPQLGASHPEGYIDTGIDLNGPGGDRAYVSVAAVKHLAQLIGWQPPGDALNAQARVGVLEREVEDLREQLREADRFAEAAEYTLNRFGSKVRSKPGRKAREEV